MATVTASCFCGTSVCVSGCRASVSETPSVATRPEAVELKKGEQLPMSGDVSSTDVVSSGFGGPWGFGGQASLKPAEVSLMTVANPFITAINIKDTVQTESLRRDLHELTAKVDGVSNAQAAAEARRQQAEIDALRQSQTNGLLQQILTAVSKSNQTA